jgi:tetrahydromethanopterin S-methyltransferase subunit C
MITQQHENEIQQKVQTTSLVMEQRWIVALFSFFGVLLPLFAGLMVSWPWQMMVLSSLILFAGVSLVVSVAVGAFLHCFAFRVWWAGVFAGVAWIVGEFLGALQRQIIEMGVPIMPGYEIFWSGQFTLFGMALIPLLFAVAIGAAVGLALGKRRALRQ